ncbi:MAG: PepSY domain-containing protein, partial [Rhodothermales bacterium]|nr:PepSY domain-containing protein [Rhodothermales bacterium]
VDMRGVGDVRAPTPDERLSPGELLNAVPDSLGDVRSLAWRSVHHAGVVEVGTSEGAWFMDARSGEVVGSPDSSIRAFFGSVTGLHRWLGAGESRSLGRTVTGVCNAAFLFMLLSGLILWWPRNWKRTAVRGVVMFRRGLSRRARNFNRHNVLGIWSVVPLIVIAATGVMLSFPTAGDAVFAAYNRVAADSGPSTPRTFRTPADTSEGMGLGGLLRVAEGHANGWRRITMTLPHADTGHVVFGVDRGTGGQPQKQAELVLARGSGEVLAFTPFERESPGTRFFEMIRYVHTGEALGAAGQLVAGLVSLAAIFLVWTGLPMAWLRAIRALRS